MPVTDFSSVHVNVYEYYFVCLMWCGYQNVGFTKDLKFCMKLFDYRFHVFDITLDVGMITML